MLNVSPIISFGLRHPPRLFHSNFVVALLSDLFGIQARSGCFCAGPYLHRTYGVDERWSTAMEAECPHGQMGAKLGLIVRTIEAVPPYAPASDPVISEGFEQIRWFHCRAVVETESMSPESSASGDAQSLGHGSLRATT